MSEGTDRFLTVRQVARRLQVHPETVRRWIRAGQLRGVRIGHAGSAAYRVDPRELAHFLAGHDAREPLALR